MVPCILDLETIMPVLRLRTISIFVNRHHTLCAPNQTSRYTRFKAVLLCLQPMKETAAHQVSCKQSHLNLNGARLKWYVSGGQAWLKCNGSLLVLPPWLAVRLFWDYFLYSRWLITYRQIVWRPVPLQCKLNVFSFADPKSPVIRKAPPVNKIFRKILISH